MVRSLRTTILFVIVVNTLFIGLDHASHPSEFGTLVSVRLAWNLAMTIAYWLAGRMNPLFVTHLGVWASGVSLLALIAAAGGLTSDYWPGIMILFLGIPVFLPLSGGQAATMAGGLLAGFAGIPVIVGEEISLREYVPPVFFAGAAALECVASSALLHRLRQSDLRQRREIEAARDHLQELDQAKSRFTANVHHELRTPLTLMLAPIESFLSGDFGQMNSRQREYMRTMHANALRLLKLINNLLDLAKIESEQLTLKPAAMDLAALSERLVTAARPLAEKKDLRLTVLVQPGLRPAFADYDATEKVLTNLLGNALKFTRAGGSVVLQLSGSDSEIEVTVTDDGIGIDPAEIEKVFDRFAQADSSSTREFEGTGIGLSLARELVELQGGRIWASSDGRGCGSRFGFSLPASESVDYATPEAQAGTATSRQIDESQVEFSDIAHSIQREVTETQAESTATHPPEEASSSNRASVLVCEDNPEMRALIADILSREFSVVTARNGQEGLALATEARPDVVVTDVMMPVMSGTEMCRELKSRPGTMGVPVVIVSSRAEREAQIEGLELGADDYVTKPFNARELLARVRSLVRLRRMQEELRTQNEALQDANSELRSALQALKEAEAQLVESAQMAAAGELAAGIAHEVNNPVNFAATAAATMASIVRELIDAIGGPEARDSEDVGKDGGPVGRGRQHVVPEPIHERAAEIEELVNIIEDGLRRTSRLVRDLSKLASPGHGRRESVDLRECVASAVRLARHALLAAGVEISVAESAEPVRVSADGSAVVQVVLNFLRNAADALEPTGGHVKIEILDCDRGWRLSVSDDGPGIDEAHQARVFEPFFSTKGPGHGVGLGLSICHRIAAEHGGRVGMASKLGVGSEFWLELPKETDAVGGCHAG